MIDSRLAGHKVSLIGAEKIGLIFSSLNSMSFNASSCFCCISLMVSINKFGCRNVSSNYFNCFYSFFYNYHYHYDYDYAIIITTIFSLVPITYIINAAIATTT